MNKLFRAGLYRLRKNKGAYACVIIPPIYSVCLMFSQYMQMKESGANYLLDPFLFHFLLVMGVLLSVFVSLYVGTEYHDGTLRNKLISGSSRNAVYGSNLWISFLEMCIRDRDMSVPMWCTILCLCVVAAALILHFVISKKLEDM